MPISSDSDKLACATLVLLGAFEFDNSRVWKRHDFNVMTCFHSFTPRQAAAF